jgi:chorismate mutase/prephenate dehydratase
MFCSEDSRSAEKTMPENSPDLSSARRKIDVLDQELIRLLQERMEAVSKVGALKDAEDAAVIDPSREAEVAEAWSSASETAGLSTFFTKRILREILDHSRRRQELKDKPGDTARLGYQGIRASYSDLTAKKLFKARGEACQNIGYHTFEAVFDALASGEVDYALVPAENSLVGSIHTVSDLLLSRETTVLDEELWAIQHCLAALPGASIDDLRKITSHPVALGQCSKSIQQLGIPTVESFDTAGAAESLQCDGDRSLGVICSREAAQMYGLAVLSDDITDHQQNETRFLLLGMQDEPISSDQQVKTSLAFAVDDRSGALAQCLSIFSARGINLTRLESRPRPGAPWEYLFLVDLNSKHNDQAVQEALGELESSVTFMRVLGTYPARITKPPR